MAECDPRDQILQLEARIEELSELVEKCRKVILIAKIAVAVGGILLLALTLGIIRHWSSSARLQLHSAASLFSVQTLAHPSKLQLRSKPLKHSGLS